MKHSKKLFLLEHMLFNINSLLKSGDKNTPLGFCDLISHPKYGLKGLTDNHDDLDNIIKLLSSYRKSNDASYKLSSFYFRPGDWIRRYLFLEDVIYVESSFRRYLPWYKRLVSKIHSNGVRPWWYTGFLPSEIGYPKPIKY
jgi:hypothetical protein